MFEIYKNIRKLRKERGWTQTILAEKVGYADKTVISKIENGKIRLAVPQIERFAEVFGVTPGELMGNPEETIAVELTKEEREVIFAYRTAERLTQYATLLVLGIKEKEENNVGD